MTLIYIAVAAPGESGSTIAGVKDDYDTCIEKLFPVTEAMAALTVRERQQFTAANGKRTMIHPGHVYKVDEE